MSRAPYFLRKYFHKNIYKLFLKYFENIYKTFLVSWELFNTEHTHGRKTIPIGFCLENYFDFSFDSKFLL